MRHKYYRQPTVYVCGECEKTEDNWHRIIKHIRKDHNLRYLGKKRELAHYDRRTVLMYGSR